MTQSEMKIHLGSYLSSRKPFLQVKNFNDAILVLLLGLEVKEVHPKSGGAEMFLTVNDTELIRRSNVSVADVEQDAAAPSRRTTHAVSTDTDPVNVCSLLRGKMQLICVCNNRQFLPQ